MSKPEVRAPVFSACIRFYVGGYTAWNLDLKVDVPSNILLRASPCGPRGALLSKGADMFSENLTAFFARAPPSRLGFGSKLYCTIQTLSSQRSKARKIAKKTEFYMHND